MVLNLVESGKMTKQQAGESLGLSPRHIKRILAAYRKEGARALAHGNRGKMPHNSLDPEVRVGVVELARSKYSGFNNQHFTELLAEREGIHWSRSTVRRILHAEGLKSPMTSDLPGRSPRVSS